MTGEELFWDLVEPMYADPAVQHSTMMGLPWRRAGMVVGVEGEAGARGRVGRGLLVLPVTSRSRTSSVIGRPGRT